MAPPYGRCNKCQALYYGWSLYQHNPEPCFCGGQIELVHEKTTDEVRDELYQKLEPDGSIQTKKEVKLATKLITDNISERLEAKWDGERLALVRHNKLNGLDAGARIIILNETEARELVKFIIEKQ